MAEVMEKSIAERVQEALQADLGSDEITGLMAAINTERSRMAVRTFELSQTPDTDGTPEDIAGRRMEGQVLRAAEEQLVALHRALDHKLAKARKAEGFANRESLTKALVKAVERASKMTAQCNACWADADEALQALNDARGAAMGRGQLDWPEPADPKHLEAIEAALEVCTPMWRNENHWDSRESQDVRNFVQAIG